MRIFFAILMALLGVPVLAVPRKRKACCVCGVPVPTKWAACEDCLPYTH